MAAIVTEPHPSRPDGRPELIVLPGGRSDTLRRRRALYRRRRLVALAGVCLIGWLAIHATSVVVPVLLEPETASSSTAARLAVEGDRYVAQPGDTMWSVARALDPSGDPRAIVDSLVEKNGFDSLQAGQVVRIPHELLARS